MPRADRTTSYVALLRAINVGGRGIVKKEPLRDAFVQAGASNVRTFMTSGNVLFDAEPSQVDTLVGDARRRLRAVLGAEPVIMVRSAAEIQRLQRRGPFAGVETAAIIKRYILFLAGAPARRPRLPVTHAKEALDLVHVAARDCWVVSRRKPSGMYGFPSLFVEEVLGVSSTARNWSTVMKLAALLSDRRGGPSGPPEPTGPTAPVSRSSRQTRTSSTARAAAASTSGRAPAGSRRARGRAGGR